MHAERLDAMVTIAGCDRSAPRCWKAPEPRYTKGALAKYAKLVGSASRGAVCG
jgi:dihydroxy-acid dehydratase